MAIKADGYAARELVNILFRQALPMFVGASVTIAISVAIASKGWAWVCRSCGVWTLALKRGASCDYCTDAGRSGGRRRYLSRHSVLA